MKKSLISAIVLGWVVALTPAPVHAQEPEPDPDPAEALRQLRGLLEGVRDALPKRSERALVGTASVTRDRTTGPGNYHRCRIDGQFTLLPFSAAHPDWSTQEAEVWTKVDMFSRRAQRGGDGYNTYRIEGEGSTRAGVSLVVSDDGTYRIRFEGGEVDALETVQYGNREPIVTPTRQCRFTISFEHLPAPEEGVDRFSGRMTDEHGATLEWSFERAGAEPDSH